jgi:Rod binding domain-containing protein
MIRRRLEMDRLRARLESGSGGEEAKKAKLREACEGFESIFLQKIWEQMRKNARQSGGRTYGREEEIYQGMYDREFSRKMVSSGGMGLADMLYEQLARSLGEKGRSFRAEEAGSAVLSASSSPSALRPELRELAPERRALPLVPLSPPLKPLSGSAMPPGAAHNLHLKL